MGTVMNLLTFHPFSLINTLGWGWNIEGAQLLLSSLAHLAVCMKLENSNSQRCHSDLFYLSYLCPCVSNILLHMEISDSVLGSTVFLDNHEWMP